MEQAIAWTSVDQELRSHVPSLGYNDLKFLLAEGMDPSMVLMGFLTRYVKLWVAHAPGMPGTFSPPPTSKETAS